MPLGQRSVHALILEDTWTTGARVQSLAHGLKVAGASTVAAIILGRHVDPNYVPAKRLLAAIAGPVFDTTHCAAED